MKMPRDAASVPIAVEVQDISALSAARRELDFPLRLWRTMWPGFVIVACLMLPFASRDPESGYISEGALFLGWLFVVALCLLVFTMKYGSAIAHGLFIVFFACFMGVNTITDLPKMWAHYAYPQSADLLPRDLAEFPPDPRLLPLWLAGQGVGLALIALSWRVVRFALLPRYAPVRRLRHLILRPIPGARLWFGLATQMLRRGRIKLRLLAAAGAGAVATVLLFCAVWQPFEMMGTGAAWGLVELSGGKWWLLLFVNQLVLIPITLGWSWVWFWLSAKARRLYDRLLIMSADEVRNLDARRPVLYLRSFRQDHMGTPSEPVEQGVIGLLDPYRETMEFETMMVRHCFAIGPVLAIADPRERSLPTGAARQLVRDGDWHDVVNAMMAESALVVVAMDGTENLKWEIDRLAAIGLRERTLFLFPDRGRSTNMLGVFLSRVFGDEERPRLDLPVPQSLRGIAFVRGRLLVLTSRTSTFFDYDIAFRILLQAHRLNATAISGQ
jgi:hypothetical protein